METHTMPENTTPKFVCGCGDCPVHNTRKCCASCDEATTCANRCDEWANGKCDLIEKVETN